MSCLPIVMALLLSPCAAGTGAWQPTLMQPSTSRSPSPPSPPSPVELAAGVGYEALTGDRSAWTDAFARVRVGVGPGATVHAEAVRTERFDLADAQLRVGASGSAGGWSGEAEVAASPTGNVLPTFSLQATVHRELGGGLVMGVGGRHHAYETGAVRIGALTTDYYTGPFRLGYALTVGFVAGETGATHAGSLSRYYGDGNELTALVAAGESVERTSPDDLLVTDIVALAVRGVHWAGPRLGLTWEATFNRHGGLYDRRGGRVGVRLRL